VCVCVCVCACVCVCVCHSAFPTRAPHATLLGTPPGARILRIINRERRSVGSCAQEGDRGDAVAVRVSGTSVIVALVYLKYGLF
jgi:hypothetical protein